MLVGSSSIFNFMYKENCLSLFHVRSNFSFGFFKLIFAVKFFHITSPFSYIFSVVPMNLAYLQLSPLSFEFPFVLSKL
jgi:hypothetical protein